MTTSPFVFRKSAERLAAVMRGLGHNVRVVGSSAGWAVEVL